MLRSVQRGLRASPQTLLPFLRNTRIFSPLLLTPLECLYIKFASDRIFSLRSPYRMAVKACGYLPPKLEKCGAWYKQRVQNFCPFFGFCTPFHKYYRRAKFWTGPLPAARDMAEKKGLPISSTGRACAAARRQGRPAVDLISEWKQISRVGAYHISLAARSDVASLSGQSQACMYMYITLSVVSVSQCGSVIPEHI